MKKYITPDMELLQYQTADLITLSAGATEVGDGEGVGFGSIFPDFTA